MNGKIGKLIVTLIYSIALSSISPLSLHSSESTALADTLYWVPEIIVEAKRITREEKLLSLSGFVASLELEGQKENIRDIPEILSSIVGVRVKQYGGLGSFATVSIRGSSSNQVMVYLDGVPLNDPFMGSSDLSDIPVVGIERVEVYRGFSPFEFGSSAIGGAINLSTEITPGNTTSKKNSLSIAASNGSFGTRRYTLSTYSKRNRISMRLNGMFLTSRGDFDFLDDRATPENPEDDIETKRENNDFTLWNLIGSISINTPFDTKVSMVHLFTKREGGVPGIGSYQSTIARSERSRNISYLKFELPSALGNRINLKTRIFRNSVRERFNDPEGDITPLRQKTDNRITSSGTNVTLQFMPITIPVCLKLFSEYRAEKFNPVSLIPSPSTGPERKRRSFSISPGLDIFLLNERAILTFNEKYEWHANEFYNEPPFPWLPPTPQGKVEKKSWSPHIGIRVNITDKVILKGNVGRYYRLPTFLELFGNLGSVTGSSELEPEEGTNRDIGIVIKSEKLSFLHNLFLEAVLLHNSAKNLILFFPNSQYTSKPTNIGEAEIKGVEFSIGTSLPEGIKLTGNYTFLDSKDTGPIPYYNGKILAGRPEHEAFVSIALPLGAVSLKYELHYIGPNYIDRANMKRVPERKIHNISVAIGSTDKWGKFNLEMKNITDNQISDINAFPLPGRSVYATLTISM